MKIVKSGKVDFQIVRRLRAILYKPFALKVVPNGTGTVYNTVLR
jgi:hypothetical protein